MPGSTSTLVVSAAPVNGFSGTIAVSFTGLPSGVTASPATFNLSASGSQQVQLSAAASAPANTVSVSITGSSGSLTESTQLQLTVTQPPTLSLSVQPSSITLVPGIQQAVQISATAPAGYNQMISGTLSNLPSGVTTTNGTTFSFFPGGTATFYFTAAAGASGGTVNISATSGSLTASAQLGVSVNTNPTFVLTTNSNNTWVISQSSSQTFSISANGYNNFNQPISVSFTGVPAGVSFSPSTFTLQPGGTPQVVTIATTFSAQPGATTVTAVGTGGGLSSDLQLDLNVVAAAINLTVQPTSLTVPAGATDSFDLSIENLTQENPAGAIQLTIMGAPSGVTISPTSYTAPAQGVEMTVFVTAASNASSGSLKITATYGPVTAQTAYPITIGSAEKLTSAPLTTADQMVRSDAITPYTGFAPPNYLIYHAATNRFFSTDAWLNQLNVIDGTSHTKIATLMIPGAFGIDQAPDGSVIYVGTMLGDLYEVDPVSLTVLKRIPSTTISPYGFAANAVYALANGKLLLESYFLVPGYSLIDGYNSLALWDPATNDITFFTTPENMNGQEPQEPICVGGMENVILTNNRTRVLIAPVVTSGGSSQLCSFDPNADTWNWSGQISGGQESALGTFAVSSDGNTLAVFDGYNIYNLDPTTLTVKNYFPVPTTQEVLLYPVMLLSQDDTQVFITDPNGADVLDEYNLSTGAETGWISELNLASPGSYTSIGPLYQAMSSSGLAAGVIGGGGVGLLDTTAVHALPVGSRFSQTQLDVPYGPVSGGTAAAWLPSESGVATPALGSVYFGTNAATSVNDDGFDSLIEAVTPPGNPGPVDVRTEATDGGSQLLPLGFSYGPSVLEAATSYATADGGGPASIYGFGFGPQLYTEGSTYIAAPSDLQISVNGTNAAIQGFSPNPYGSTYYTSPPLPTNAVLYTVPPGVAGTTAPITVTNSSGTTTSTTQMTYLPAVQQYSVSGQLADGVYDPTRDVYYFTDASEVRVFSVTQGAWLASIPIPAPKGAYGPQRLYGIALSPDGSKLAIGDPGAIAIYVLDPDDPSSIQSFPFATLDAAYPQSDSPAGIAVSNSGMVYFETYWAGGDSGAILSLNTSTGQFGTIPGYPCGAIADPDVRVALSNDGTRLYFNCEGLVGYYDTDTATTTYGPAVDPQIGQGSDELVLGANQTSLFVDGFFTDSNLNNLGLQTLDNAETLDAEYLYGGALSADGSLYFQPGTQFIDVFNGQTGAFRSRVSLPVPLSPNFRALVSDGQDSQLVAITGATGNGIAVVNLNSMPEPQPLPYISRLAAPAANLSRPLPARSVSSVSTATLPMFVHNPLIRHRRSTLLDSLRHIRALPLSTPTGSSR